MSAFKIREANGNDLSFIYDTWLNSFRHYSALGKRCRNSIFYDNYKKVIDLILTNEDTTVLIAHSHQDENHIFSYLVHEPAILHYIFCKEAYWGFGIPKALFVEAFGSLDYKVDITHRTFMAEPIINKFQNLTYNPFHLYKKGA